MDHSSAHQQSEHSEAKHDTDPSTAQGGSPSANDSAAAQALALAKKKKLIKVLAAVLAISGLVAGGSYQFLKSNRTSASKSLAHHDGDAEHAEEEGDEDEEHEHASGHAPSAAGHASPAKHGADSSRAPAHANSHTSGHTSGHGPASKTEQGAHGSKTPKHAQAGHGTDPHGTAAAPKETVKKGWLAELQGVWASVQAKADRLRSADEENERLRLENANLRLKLAAVQYDRGLKGGLAATHRNAQDLHKQAGSRAARTPASITYRPPVHLLPAQLLTLGVSYFRGREDEKAAVIFTFLVDQEESESFKVPKNYLLAGASWYRLDNLELADKYFARVLESRDLKENLPYQAQARLWRALVAERQGKGMKTQYWMQELVDHHPHALETAWVNTKAPAQRQPAAAHGKGQGAGADDDDAMIREKKPKKPAPSEHGHGHHKDAGHEKSSTGDGKGHGGGHH